MDPPGIKVIFHKHPKGFSSCSPHALSRWYIGPSLGHYCCHQICIPATISVNIGQTVSWFNHKLIMTTSPAIDIIIATTKYLTAALNQTNKNTLLPPYDTTTSKSLFQIYVILSNTSSERQRCCAPSQFPT